MTVRTRPDLADLPPYRPGRTVAGAIKLASNETAHAPLPSVQQAVAEAAAGMNRYPDAASTALISELSGTLSVPEEQLAVGCGSVMLCEQLVQATCGPGDEVLYAWRSFEAYPLVTKVAGAEQVPVPLDAALRHDLDAMLAAITPRTRLIFVCSPNNPTGTTLRRQELDAFLDAVPPHILVVLDEAYHEYVDDQDVPDGMDYVHDRDNVLVLRTFSKAYGLAGLRVGYAAGPRPAIDAVRAVTVPFTVNSLAQTAAIASLRAREELLGRCREVIEQRTRVRQALVELGHEVPESHGNFIWLPLGERTAAFAEHCIDHKVVVRAFADGALGGVRVTLSTPEENEAFLDAVRAWT